MRECYIQNEKKIVKGRYRSDDNTHCIPENWLRTQKSIMSSKNVSRNSLQVLLMLSLGFTSRHACTCTQREQKRGIQISLQMIYFFVSLILIASSITWIMTICI